MSFKPALPALCLLLTAVVTAQEPTEPLTSDLSETVEVRYVILDALVLDDRGRVVPDLTIDDFKLYLDLRPHPIDSVDVFCPAGAADDPRPVNHGKRRLAPVAPDVFRRIVVVVDYKNLEQTERIDAIDRLERMVRDSNAVNEELMIVAITKELRVEQPFTTDREEVLRALARMKLDRSLWQEYPNMVGRRLRPHLHEFALFDGLAALVRWLGTYEGSKAIVFVSELPSKFPDRAFARPLTYTPPAFDYDRQFEAVATAAAEARVAVYPIHANGISLGSSSERLARLAVETGGRFTRHTDDLSLAYARAQRDLACRYSIAFYDRNPESGRLHRVNIKAKGGLRVHHPSLYRFGTIDDAVEAIDAESYTAPAHLRSARIQAQGFPVKPLDDKHWKVALALRFPVSVPPEGDNVVEFGAKLDHQALQSVYTVSNSVTVPPETGGSELPVVTVDPIDLRPGRYDLSIRVDDPRVGEPRTAIGHVDIPALPRRGVVVAGPILLRPAPDAVLLHWSEGGLPIPETTGAAGFEPVFPGEAVEPESLIAVTHICRILPRAKGTPAALEVKRTLLSGDGSTASTLPTAILELPVAAGVTCRRLIDQLPAALGPGDYRFEVSIEAGTKAKSVVRTAMFSVR